MQKIVGRIFGSFLVLIFFTEIIKAQDSLKISPYTVQTTFEKLQKDHPFISMVPKINSHKIISQENLIYKSIDDLDLKADIYYPKNSENLKFTAVILVHGGGWASGSKENQRDMAQQLAENGFLAMAVNYRLSPVAKYPAAVNDLNDAINYLIQSEFPVNKSKIAILGASAGAQLASLIGMKFNSNKNPFDNKIKAIINVDGIVSFIHPEAEESKYAAYWLGGEKNENYAIWQDASPLEFINPYSPPILFINSSQPRFHAGRDDLTKKYTEWKIHHEVYTIKDSPHSFWLVNPWFESTLSLTIQFLTKIFNDDSQ